MEGVMDMMETLEEQVQAETNLVIAYVGCGEFREAKGANTKECRSTDISRCVNWFQSGRIEYGLCNNYEAAIAHYRKYLAEVQIQEYDSPSRTRNVWSVDLAITLLRHSAKNEAEAFAIFQEELDRCVDPLNRKMILNNMGTECRKLNKWDQSIEALHQLCFSATRPGGTMLSHAKQQFQIAQTYLESTALILL